MRLGNALVAATLRAWGAGVGCTGHGVLALWHDSAQQTGESSHTSLGNLTPSSSKVSVIAVSTVLLPALTAHLHANLSITQQQQAVIYAYILVRRVAAGSKIYVEV